VLEVVEADDLHSGFLQGLARAAHMAGGHEAGIGDEKSALEAELAADLAQPRQGPGSEDGARAQREVEPLQGFSSRAQSWLRFMR
jgi:hypothetical protein